MAIAKSPFFAIASICLEKIYLKSKSLPVAVIIEVSEYMYQSNMVVEKEITFMACIAKLIKTVTK